MQYRLGFLECYFFSHFLKIEKEKKEKEKLAYIDLDKSKEEKELGNECFKKGKRRRNVLGFIK